MNGRIHIKNIGLLQTPLGSLKHGGKSQGENLKLKNASILIEGGIIKEIAMNGEFLQAPWYAEEIDAGGRLVTPGLIDSHTHPVFGGYREHEIPLKLSGASYLDILKAGGGILDTVQKTREASSSELYAKTSGFLSEMLKLGVTTIEAKSGYGLDLASETKQLEVLMWLDREQPVDIISTFMGAHAVPKEYKGRADEFIEMLCKEVIPYVSEHKLAEFCDVFCEDSVFSVEQSQKYLLCAQKHGLGLKIHADEIEEIGGAELSGELKTISAEHLIATGELGMSAMANGGVIAALLPATSFYLDKGYAPARRMIELGIPIAIASDFNPGSCPSLNLQFAMNLGYLKYKMTPEEILTAVTINAACAVGREKEVGTLEVGKKGDFVIWDAPNMEMLCYRFGSNLAWQVYKKGGRVV